MASLLWDMNCALDHKPTQWDYFSQLECKLKAMDLSFLPTEVQQTPPSTKSQITTDKGNH